jgi:hypothetical protein
MTPKHSINYYNPHIFVLFSLRVIDIVFVSWWSICFEASDTSPVMSPEDWSRRFPKCCVRVVCCDNGELLININDTFSIFIIETNLLTRWVTTSFLRRTAAWSYWIVSLLIISWDEGRKYFFLPFPCFLLHYLPHFKAVPLPLLFSSVITFVSSPSSLISTVFLSAPFRCPLYGHSFHLILAAIEIWASPISGGLSPIVTEEDTKVFLVQ